MSPAERIQRMLKNGVLTEGQAEQLRASLGIRPAHRTTAEPAPSHAARWAYGGAALLVAGAFVLFFSGSNGDELIMVQDVEQSLNRPGAAASGSGKLISALLLIAVVPLLAWGWLHNSLVNAEERVFAAWAQVESTYQRRADLVPALLETVTTFMAHEQKTLESVVIARSEGRQNMREAMDALLESQRESAAQFQALGGRPPEDSAAITSIQESQARVGGLMRNILAVGEDYPELRSADQFLELQAQLEGTENRINVARMRFNTAAGEYNAAIRRMPANLVAAAGGFQRKAYFQADDQARTRPELNF